MKAEKFFEKEFNKFGLKSQRKYPNEELCRFLGRKKNIFKKNMRCLEVGVGGGGNLMPLIDMNFRIDAIDISSTAINLLKKKYKKIKFKKMNMLDINKLNKKYDLVIDIFSSYSLDTKSGKKFLSKVNDILKDNAIFFSYFPSKKSDTWLKSSKKYLIDKNTLIKINNKKLPYYGNNYPFRFHSKNEYLRLFTEHGLKINYCETITKTYLNEKFKTNFLVVEGQKCK
tara:strand:- start:268 stop:948 length:681 start_codon:yes stop_codon:yes gene_type:complete